MVKILWSIFVFLLISPFLGFGQKKSEVWRYEGPRIGIDISRFLMPYIQRTTRSGLEIQADYPYKGNWFPTVEAGYLSIEKTYKGKRPQTICRITKKGIVAFEAYVKVLQEYIVQKKEK